MLARPETPPIRRILIVGGKGTWPSMRATLQQMGIGETDFLRECDASFKQRTQFYGWVDGGDTDDYYHQRGHTDRVDH